MKTEKGQHIYFLGIGGIGMSALARYFKGQGAIISGYDKTRTALTEKLEQEGIAIHYSDDSTMIPDETSLVVYTPAIPATLNELAFIKEKGIPLLKRAEVLGKITESIPTIAIAGTHGKTTITSMITHLLYQAGIRVTAFIGGIANNFQSNLVTCPDAEVIVVEADEYDKSFLKLRPQMAVVSSMDADHLDIYNDHLSMISNYQEFVNGIKTGGKLIHREGLPLQRNTESSTYAISASALSRAENPGVENGRFRYDWYYGNNPKITIRLKVAGRHNIENALAASTVAIQYGIEQHVIAKALESYSGVWRRFDSLVNGPKHFYIDDYAHHPEELKACISAAKELFPDKKICGIFQPHLYSRTRDFMDGFAESLSMLDELILLDIYPAREEPIPGVTSEKLLHLCTVPTRQLLTKTEVIDYVSASKPEVLLTLGAGDIDQLVEPLQYLIESW